MEDSISPVIEMALACREKDERQVTMAQRIKVTDPFAEVRLNTIKIGDREDHHKAVEILDDEGVMRTVAIQGPDYELVPNTLAREIGQDVMSRSDFNWEHDKTLWNGSFISMLYRSDKQVDLPEVGEVMAYGLRIENSYNGSIKLRVSTMAWILSCLNGMTHPEIFGHYTFRHDSRGDNKFDMDDAIACVQSGVNCLDIMQGKIAKMSSRPFALCDLADISSRLSFPKSSWKDVLEELDKSSYEDKMFTYWDAYQAFTQVVTHKMSGVSSLNYSDRVGKQFLELVS